MKKLPFPNRITIELTNQCNVSCKFCPRQVVPMKIGYMESGLFKKIIDEAALHLPIKAVIFFRGESLLHPEFIELVNYAKNKGIGPIQYATNAFQLTNELSDLLVESGVDFISFSLDTLDEEVYRKSRLSGDLNISIANVKYLCDLCKTRLENGLTAPILQVSTIETEQYMKGQDAFISYWVRYVDIVRVYYEHDDMGKIRNHEIETYLRSKVPVRKPCRKVFTDFLIYWNGDLALCNYDWKGAIPQINVRDMSIQEAWDSIEYELIRKMHLDNCFDNNLICTTCEHWRIDYIEDGFLGKMYEGKLKMFRGGIS